MPADRKPRERNAYFWWLGWDGVGWGKMLPSCERQHIFDATLPRSSLDFLRIFDATLPRSSLDFLHIFDATLPRSSLDFLHIFDATLLRSSLDFLHIFDATLGWGGVGWGGARCYRHANVSTSLMHATEIFSRLSYIFDATLLRSSLDFLHIFDATLRRSSLDFLHIFDATLPRSSLDFHTSLMLRYRDLL